MTETFTTVYNVFTTNYVGEPMVKVSGRDTTEEWFELLDTICRAYGYNPLDNTLRMYGSAHNYNSLAISFGWKTRA